MINDLIALLFFSRDYAHRAHLRTSSFAAHKALETFYTEMTEAVDKLVETYQGRFEMLDIGYLHDKPDVMNPLEVLTKHYHVAHAMRYTAIPKDETMLQNQIDEIEAVFAQTLYKLKTFA